MTMMIPFTEAPPPPEAPSAIAGRGRRAERDRSGAREQFGAMVDDALASIGGEPSTGAAEAPSTDTGAEVTSEREPSGDTATVNAAAAAAVVVVPTDLRITTPAAGTTTGVSPVGGIDALAASNDPTGSTTTTDAAAADDAAAFGELDLQALGDTPVVTAPTGDSQASAATDATDTAALEGLIADALRTPGTDGAPTLDAAERAAAFSTAPSDAAPLDAAAPNDSADVPAPTVASLGVPSTDVDDEAATDTELGVDALDAVLRHGTTSDAQADVVVPTEPPRVAATTGASDTPAVPDAAPDLAMTDPGEPWEQVARALHGVRRDADGTHRMTIRLDPPDLGTVEIEVQVRSGRLSVHALVDSHATRDALARALPELRASLEAGGLSTDSLDVGARSSGDQGTGGQPAAPPRTNARSGSGPSAPTRADASDAIAATNRSTDNANRLDLHL